VKGGEIVAEGVPATVAKAKGSFTRRYLAPLLKGRGMEAVAAE
jgi:excinuclease ABC subunit A